MIVAAGVTQFEALLVTVSIILDRAPYVIK
jgi:hypothetical protein